MIIFWSIIGFLGIIVEILTTTFFGFSIAIGAFAAAGFSYMFSQTEFNIYQCIVFAIFAIISAIIFTKIFSPKKKKDVIQGLDVYIGQKQQIVLVNNSPKLILDGVPYLFSSDENIGDGDFVKILDRKGSLFIVEKIKN